MIDDSSPRRFSRDGRRKRFSNFMVAVSTIGVRQARARSSAPARCFNKRRAGCRATTQGYFRPHAGRPGPEHELFTTEYFGPILGVYVFDDGDYDTVMRQMEGVAAYALTGSIFAQDRAAIADATDFLRFAAGNFYINDKPTGAVVGQQPFGGARASGTNDKAGAPQNLSAGRPPAPSRRRSRRDGLPLPRHGLTPRCDGAQA